MWDICSSSQTLFSAVHLHHLYKKVMLHITEIITQQFSFLLFTHEVNKLSMNLKNHLLTFLKLEAQFKLSYNALTSHIASSLLMNTYSSDMHHESLTDSLLLWCFSWMFVCWLCVQSLTLCSKFDSVTVFQTLYKSLCLQVLQMSYDCQSFVNFQCQCIENHLSAMFIAMNHHFNSSAQLHQDNLRVQKMNWTHLRTNTICLFCLQQKSKHVLMCGHAVCDTCVQIFEQALSALKYHYSIHTCMLCQSESLTTWLKPPTAEYWVLSVNREEPQGIISLKFMKLIQDLVCECSVQDLFDDIRGISSDTEFNLT